MDELAPMIAFALFASVGIVLIISSAVKKIREREIRHRERMRAMELGVALPPDVDETQNKRKNGRQWHESVGLQGVIWTGIGAGVLLGRAMIEGMTGVDSDLRDVSTFFSIWGVPALFVGIGLILYARTLRRNRREGEDA